MAKPLVSVIIPNYNYEKFIDQTVASVLSQTYENIEIIVVDDGSKDDSLEVLKKYGNKINIITQKNQGVAAARNNGVKNSSGEYVAFLDADDIWLPDKIDKQLDKFATDKELKLVHCSIKLIDSDNQVIGENTAGMEGDVAEELLKLKRGVVIGIGSTGILEKKIFDELEGFDQKLSTAADWDLSYRLATKYKIGFVQEPYVLYRVHGTNMHQNVDVMKKDMLLGFEKAFAQETTVSRRECYGNLHLTLSGSYFHSKQYPDFIKHAFKSIFYKLSNLIYFAKYPLRQLKRKRDRLSNKEIKQ